MNKKMFFSTTIDNVMTPNIANPTFVRATIIVMQHDVIANRTMFSKQAIDNARYGLNYLPVRGYYLSAEDGGDDNFGGHEIEYYLDDNGELKSKTLTVPMGVVIDGTSRWETVEINGNYEEVLKVDCYLWREGNEEAIDRVTSNDLGQSMEITVNDYEDKGDYINITDYSFTALTILGSNVPPAFSNSNIRVGAYSQNDFKVDYQKMMTALDKFLNFEEGGVIVEDNKEILEEAVENNVEEVVETVSEDNKEETFEAEQEEVVEDVENNEEKVEEETTIDYSVEFESLQAKYSELETSKNELNIKYEALMEEVCELREYKATKEKEYREAKERELFARFETLKDEERFVKLVENKANYSLEELEEKCYAIKGMLAEAKESKKSKKVENTPLIDKVYSANLEDNTIGKYDAFIKKYSKNN